VRFLLALLLLVPLASAHGAPAVLDNEIILVADEGSDDAYAMDGFDLQFMYAREAFMHGELGVIFRLAATAGPYQPVWGPFLMEFDVGVNGTTHTIGFASADGTGWTGDYEVTDETIAVIDGGIVEINFQAFVPLSDLGLSVNETMDIIHMRSWAKSDLVDVSPGGYYLPGAGSLVELTHWGVGVIETPQVTLAGPTTYTKTSYANQTVTVKSLITVAGQHLSLFFMNENGWEISTPTQLVEVDPGATVDFPLTVTSVGAAPMPFSVRTDLGGLQQFYLINSPTGPLMSESPRGASSPTPVSEESPGLAIVALIGAIALLTLRHRK
jgi:hypothetical protein